MSYSEPTLGEIQRARQRLGRGIVITPVWRWRQDLFGTTKVWLKLELWQYTGSFKARAALLALLNLTPEEKKRGVIAITAGNHGIAVSYAAHLLKISAKIFMPKTASPIRIAKCQYYGAQVVLMEDIQTLFAKADHIQAEEKKTLIHPFNGDYITLGTGTLGMELFHQIKNLNAIIVPVGGGGLISGIANACRQLNPDIQIYGVEPHGADVMSHSLRVGKPASCPVPNSIADSLCAPCTAQRPFQLCQKWVDEMVTVSDTSIVQAMSLLFTEAKLAVEPAAAVGVAGLLGPLKEKLVGQKIAIVLSGANIDENRYCQLLSRHE